MSNPPTFATISIGLLTSGLFLLIASLTTHFFFSKASLVIPAPFPTASSILHPVKLTSTELLVVVLPIPISPTPNISYSSS